MKSIVFTMDVDWASEDVLKYALDHFEGLPLGIFMTHPSPVIENAVLAGNGKMQMGIHPNFFPTSTHGKFANEVIDHCLGLVPNAKMIRSHGLMFSSDIMLRLSEMGVNYDLSIISPLADPMPPITFNLESGIFKRFTFNWEDDLFFYYPNGQQYYEYSAVEHLDMLVVNFHPIHIFLNSRTKDNYADYRNKKILRNEGVGTETFLTELINEVKKGRRKALSLSEYFAVMERKNT